MKLNANQIAAVKQDLSADPLEEQNPAMASLRQAFGDHTFYVGAEGLFVVEPLETAEPAEGDKGDTHPGEPAQLVLVAAWADDDKKALQPVPPQQTQTVVDLAKAVNGKAGEA